MTVRSQDLDVFITDTLGCGTSIWDLKYIGDLGLASVFWCVDCGMEHVVSFGDER